MSSSGHTDRSVPLTEALAISRANKVGRMVGRAGDNRIEPECWPVVKPGFQFSKDHKFFTIGSCFAGNIGRRLKVDGYKVHGSEAMPGEQRNRYTPASIFQEIEWAGRIFHPTVARALRHVGIGVLAGSLFKVFAVTNLTRLFVDVRGNYAWFDLSAIVLGVVGAALILMARVVDEARAVRAELDEIL